MKWLLIILLCLPAQAVLSQDNYSTLKKGNFAYTPKSVDISRRIRVNIIPQINYVVNPDKSESITIQFRLEWYQNEEKWTPDKDRIFLIYDAEKFIDFANQSDNFRIARRLRGEIINSLAFVPPDVMEFNTKDSFEYFPEISGPIDARIVNDDDQAFSMNLICYLGEFKVPVQINDKSETLTWKFKLPPPSERPECATKYNQYAEQFDALKQRHQFEQYQELARKGEENMLLKWKQTDIVLNKMTGLSSGLENLNNNVDQDIVQTQCENLQEIRLDINRYMEAYNRELPTIQLLKGKIKHIRDSVAEHNRMVSSNREAIQKSSSAIQKFYRELKFMQWNNSYDSLKVAGIETWLEHEHMATDAKYNSQLALGAAGNEVWLDYHEFNGYYNASLEVIKWLKAGQGQEPGLAQVAGDTGKGKKRRFPYWIIIPVVALLGGFFIFKYWKFIKKGMAKKNKIKSA